MDQVKSSADTASPSGELTATSLRRALSILGDPWTMLILKEAFNGVRRFSAFQRALNVPKQTLSLRLAHLCREQMLYRRYLSPRHTTLEYAPTAKTHDLQQAMYSIWLWHEAHPGDVDVLPFDIVHNTCGKRLAATFRCMHCSESADSRSIDIRRSDPPQFEDSSRARLARRNDAAFTAVVEHEQAGLVAATLVGDVACNEILYLLFQGPRHMQAIAAELGLGLPVVRGRLDKLRDLGLVSEQRDGRKLIYSTLPRAEGFYPLLLSIAAWGDRWCNQGQPPPELIVHECGNLLRGRFACDHCGEWVMRENASIVPKVEP